ncbi:MAG: hypothetical protein IT236_04790 [Bacteroidia bacterium]|nr:hypothetical protein [Bacteroidia bacterium]
MKKLILFSSLLFTINFYGQDKPVELNCYNKWAAKFEERGGDAVADGVYDDVIITNRQGAKATCNNGRAEVRQGKLVKMYILLSDGTYEEVKRTWKDKSTEGVAITNGISSSRLTIHNELFNVIWPKKLKAKKAKPTEAPEPADD